MRDRLSGRQVVRCALLLFAGGSLSLLVAQACALWAPIPVGFAAVRRTTQVHAGWVDGGRDWNMTADLPLDQNPGPRFERLAELALPLWNGQYGTSSDLPLAQRFYVQAGVCVEYETFIMGYDATDAASAVLFGVRAGWPFTCVAAYRYRMVYGWSNKVPEPPYWVGAVTPPKFLHPKSGAWNLPRVIPVRPVWSGLVLNSLVWAVPLGLVLSGARRLRRRRRDRLGCCRECGYSLTGIGGAVCPECGAGRALAETGVVSQPC